MSASKYWVAKYIPDLPRFEPRNIGVIACGEDKLEARFAAEIGHRPGDVDGRSIPAFVTSSNAYRQWITYWRSTLSSESDVTQVINEIVSSSRGNFVVVEGGEFFEPVRADELPRAVNQLFSILVESSAPDENKDLDFDDKCNNLMAMAGLLAHPYFVDKFPLKCTVHGAEEEYVFSHAMRNGTLQRLYQRWPTPKRKRDISKNLHDTAWTLEQVTQNAGIPAENIVVIVDATSEQLELSETNKAMKILGSMSRLVNVQNVDDALSVFQRDASIPAEFDDIRNVEENKLFDVDFGM